MDVRASAVDGLEVVEDELVFKLYGHVRREYNPGFFFLSIFNSNYFIRKVKLIYGNLLLVEHRVVHKKKYKKFVLV